MSSIRKTKKRLKREIAEMTSDICERDIKTVEGCCLADAIYQHIKLLERELQQLKRKKDER